jgi:ferredoxin
MLSRGVAFHPGHTQGQRRECSRTLSMPDSTTPCVRWHTEDRLNVQTRQQRTDNGWTGTSSIAQNPLGFVAVVRTRAPRLDVLFDADVDVEYSCREGLCGACETRVLGGCWPAWAAARRWSSREYGDHSRHRRHTWLAHRIRGHFVYATKGFGAGRGDASSVGTMRCVSNGECAVASN